MIQVEKLSYGFPAKDSYKEVSFTLKMGQHCAFTLAFKKNELITVEKLCDQLEALSAE